MKQYPLWGFFDSRIIVYTRGETQEQAYKHACKNWKRGQTISWLDTLPITAAKAYSTNHPFDWLNKAPKWLEKEQS